MNPSDAIEAIENRFPPAFTSLSRHIQEHLRKLTSHEPVIGTYMGKTGPVNPHSVMHCFRGGHPVSDVHAGTRKRRSVWSGHGHSMVITDLPGEERDRDAEHEALYRDILPELTRTVAD